MVLWDLARVTMYFQGVMPNALCKEFEDEGDQGQRVSEIIAWRWRPSRLPFD